MYNGGKLIAEYTGTKRVDYLYDENGMLYGFIYNNAKYFYIRDTLQNILGIVDANGNAVVHYNYTAYGECKAITGSKATTIGVINSFRYKGYYFDAETEFFYCNARYYSPDIKRFLQASGSIEFNLCSINELNLYTCANKDFIHRSCNAVSKKMIPTASGVVIPSHANIAPLTNSAGHVTKKTSTDKLNFAVGLLTPQKYGIPSWMSIYAFYAKGTLGWSYTFDEGYSLASFSTGILDTTFHTPKWFSSLSDDNLANPNIYLGVGTWNANASVGVGFSGTAEIISGTIGIQFGDALSVGVKGYIGAGISIDFTNGIKFGVGWGPGYEISLNIDWYELFH